MNGVILCGSEVRSMYYREEAQRQKFHMVESKSQLPTALPMRLVERPLGRTTLTVQQIVCTAILPMLARRRTCPPEVENSGLELRYSLDAEISHPR